MILKLSAKDVKAVIACFMLAGVMMYVYKIPFKKAEKLFAEKQIVLDRLVNIDNQLDNFAETKLKLKALAPKIEEIVSGYKAFMLSNDEIINTYKTKVISVLKQHDVTDFKESIKSLQDNNSNIVLEFDFNINYERLYKLLFDIEKFSIISKLEYKNSNVVFECSPILHSASLNDYFLGRQTQNIDDILKKGLFYEAANKVTASVEIGYIPTLKDLLPTPRNPFFKSIEKQIEQTKTNTKKTIAKDVARAPDITLDGILYDEKNPVAIIDGNLYQAGSVYKKVVKIKKINPSSVDVEYSGKIFKIKMLN